MHKAINITINNQIFYIEEDAYELLASYLESIKRHFAFYEDCDEIVEDIESRIAEKLSARVFAKKKVITGKDVLAVTKSMGTVSDFADFEEDAPQRERADSNGGGLRMFDSGSKKLYRDMDNAMIAGVAAGIAAYFGVDPIIIRLLFVLTLFAGGTGIIIYIILWFVMPEAKTDAQKVEMRGDRVTVRQIEKEVKERIEKIDTKKIERAAHEAAQMPAQFARRLAGFCREVFRHTAPAVLALLRVIFGIVGILLIVAAVVALIAVGFSVVAALFGIGTSFINFPIGEVLPGSLRYAAFISLFFIVAVPLILLIMIGSSFVRARSTFNLLTSVTLISVWVIALMVGGVIGLERAPEIQDKIQEIELQYAESVQTKTFDNLEDFYGIKASNAYNLTITKADEFSASMTGIDKDLDKAKVFVNSGVLTIERKDSFEFCVFCSKTPVKIAISMPLLEEIELSGASKAIAEGFFGESFASYLSGASRLQLSGDFASVTLDISGASRAELEGTGDQMLAKLSGAGKLYGEAFSVREADINASGASKAWLAVAETLNVDASGASTVEYSGNALISDITTSGSGRVEKK